MIFERITKNSNQTKKIGESWAKKIIKINPQKSAILIGLEGDLGGGKTTFLQGFAKGLRIEEKVLSPTFVIFRKYKIPNTKYMVQNFYHFDCYRIKDPKEILSLGFKKVISCPGNVVAVEWADRIKDIIPKNAIWIAFEFINKNKREIRIKV